MYGKRKRSQWDGDQGGQAKRHRGAHVFRKTARFGGKGGRYVSHRRKASQVIIRQPSSLPDRLYVKLVYREQLSWSQAANQLADNVYRGNSLFDPDLTGTGGQPFGFDQWTAFYGSYTVLGSSIEVVSMLNNNSAVGNTRAAVIPTNTSSQFGAAQQELAEEVPYGKWGTCRMGAAGVGQCTVKSYMSTAKMAGVVRPAVQIADSFSALYTANPTAPWFWHVINYFPGGSVGNQSLIQNVKLTYYCVFEGRFLATLS